MGVYARDLLNNADMSAIKSALESRFQARAWLLDSDAAIAVVPTSIAVSDFSSEELLKREQAESALVYNFLHEFEGARSGQAVSVPDGRYSIIALFPKSEETFIMRMSAREWSAGRTLLLKVHFKIGTRNDRVDRVRGVVLEWHKEACQFGFGGEKLQDGPITVQGLVEGPKTMQLCFTFDYPMHVTIPWLELYFRVRSCLKKTQRPLGFSFH